MILEDCSYHVQPAGNRKVRKKMQKNVHAYVKGEIIARNIEDKYSISAPQVSYDPYKTDYFYKCATGDKIESSKLLYFSNQGKVYEVN